MALVSKEPSGTKRWHIAGSVGVIVALHLAAAGQTHASDTRATDKKLIGWLSELQPLPKVHYSWPLKIHSIPPELLFQYARITNAISLSAEGYLKNKVDVTTSAMDLAVRTCARINARRPATRCTIALTYSVWHREFGKSLPPTDTGSSHQAELQTLRNKLQRMQADMQIANKRTGSSVQISAVIFDSERFTVKEDDASWNAAITDKHNRAYDVARKVFPDARIEWYARGGIAPASTASGWRPAQFLTTQEKGRAFGATLYRVPEIEVTRQTFRRTFTNARKRGVSEVTPWIALASGYRRQVQKFHTWSFDWNYDHVYSWQLGLEVNQRWFGDEQRAERFAPWHAAKVVLFYPEPFSRTPHWGTHFVAYVRGANMIRKISDLQDR